MDNKLALAMIVKGDKKEVQRLRRCLQSVSQYVDGIFITLTSPINKFSEIEKICKEFNVTTSYFQPSLIVTPEMITWFEERFKHEPHIKVGDKLFEFDTARNFNFGQVPKEYKWILWLDCDDVFRNGHNLRPLIHEAIKSKSDAILLNYLYQVETNEKDEITKIITQHPRERIIRNSLEWKWKGLIHEILTKPVINNPVTNNDCDIVHLVDHEDRLASLWRNINSCEAALARTKGEDSRFIYYLAKLLSDLRTDKTDREAQGLMFEYLLGPIKSAWEEERGQIWGYIADIYNRHGEHQNAINALMNGLMDYPESRSLFISIASSYTLLGKWAKALFWLSLIDKIPEKQSLLAANPHDQLVRILEIKYNCYNNLARFAEARIVGEEIKKYVSESVIYDNVSKRMEDLLKKETKIP
jgi:hypothetical protein